MFIFLEKFGFGCSLQEKNLSSDKERRGKEMKEGEQEVEGNAKRRKGERHERRMGVERKI